MVSRIDERTEHLHSRDRCRAPAFILLINELSDAILRRMGVEAIQKYMRFILDDAAAHFNHERIARRTT
ncbi:hypothetical protein MIZ01_1673 [Sideroxyarcus emersonii]|uniref:Uncharacterized protein n=1 Tax=Sideroxyarcus emersonii TaxID=2764705 RepID=A0AAN2BZA4_9PROT|nr:hypothetical protein MIZ01_1673 [Sideroxyarcus emersonii]